MVKNKEIKTSQDILKLEEKNKNTLYTFGFKYFEKDSKVSLEKKFNNNYSSITHFLKTNSDFIKAVKEISNETYKSTIIENKLNKRMHFKILEREESRNRITEILVDVYEKNVKVVEELKEGSQFVEFGMTKGCRYIGVIIDYHIIELLYFDPNHLTFADYEFNVSSKMSYTVPSIYDLKSEKHFDSDATGNKLDLNKYLSQKYDVEKENENSEMLLLIASDLYDKKITEKQAIQMLLECEEERRNEK